MSDPLTERRRALEESFFRRRDAELIKRLHDQLELDAHRHELAMVSGLSDQKLLDRLLYLELGSDAVAALSLVPMVRVAWADGRLESKERNAILKAAVAAGLPKESPSYHWLTTWLQTEPDDELNNAWMAYAKALAATLSDEDRVAIQTGLVDRLREVAQAAGGLLGIISPISPEEQRVIDEVEAAFNP